MDIARRVAARFELRRADTIGDPSLLVQKFQDVLEDFARLESQVPKMREAEPLLGRVPQTPEEKQILHFYSSTRYEFLFKVTKGYARFHNVGYDLFLALLQQYELPPAIRKKVEAAAKFYSRATVQKPPRGKEVDAYLKYLSAYRDQLELAKAVISQNKPRGQAGTDAGSKTVTAGPFTIVNTGGFDDSTMEEAAKVVEKAAGLLSHKGLSRVCYGEILLSNTLSRSSVLAFYLLAKDEMFVRANLKGKGLDAVETVIHELAHRLHFKFLKSKDRDIRSIYFRLGMKDRDRQREMIADPTLRPQPGDTMTSKGKVYQVEKVGYDKVELTAKDNPAHKASIPLVSWIALKGTAGDKHPSTFVSEYAKKNHEENFAEMVTAYCLGRLPEDQVEMLEEVLR